MPEIKGVTFEIVLDGGARHVAHFIRPDKVAALVEDNRITVGDLLKSLASEGNIDINGVERFDAEGTKQDPEPPLKVALDPSQVVRLSAELEAVLPGVVERAGLAGSAVGTSESTRETVLLVLLGMVVGYARQEGITDAFLHQLLDYCGSMQVTFPGAADA